MTIQQALNWAYTQLQNSPSPHLDAEVILFFLLKISRETLLSHPEKKLSIWQRIKYTSAINKRRRGLPVPYITGVKEFYGRSFIVNKNVLIPRPESEQIIDLIKEKNLTGANINLLDLGTGSGCLAITLSLELPLSTVLASDISRQALDVARLNAKNHNANIVFRHGNLLTPWLGSRIDVLVANLPYVKSDEFDNEPSIQHEPITALLENPSIINELCLQLKHFSDIKLIILESSPLLTGDWRKKLRQIFPTTEVSIIPDASGRQRFLLIDNRH